MVRINQNKALGENKYQSSNNPQHNEKGYSTSVLTLLLCSEPLAARFCKGKDEDRVSEMEKNSSSNRSELASLATSWSMMIHELGIGGMEKVVLWWFLGVGFRGLGLFRKVFGGRKTFREGE